MYVYIYIYIYTYTFIYNDNVGVAALGLSDPRGRRALLPLCIIIIMYMEYMKSWYDIDMRYNKS